MTNRERLVELLKKSHDEWLQKEYDHETDKNINEYVADYLIENGVVVPPCKIGDEIKGEIVHQIEYIEMLGFEGNISYKKLIHTCDKKDTESTIFASHPITWEEAERAVEGDRS